MLTGKQKRKRARRDLARQNQPKFPPHLRARLHRNQRTMLRRKRTRLSKKRRTQRQWLPKKFRRVRRKWLDLPPIQTDIVAPGGATEISGHRGGPNTGPRIEAEAPGKLLLVRPATVRQKGL